MPPAVFGQLVVGPPGSGKTTYVCGAAQLLRGRGRRVAIVNLDPANDVSMPYEPDVDVAALVRLEDVMREQGLGPNGGMLFCFERLADNLDWLRDRLAPHVAEGAYLLIDCPGQVELFTQQAAFKRVLAALTGEWGHRLAALHLVDAYLASDAPKYISALLLSLDVMLHLELPHVNVLSKVDIVRAYGELDFPLDYYTRVGDLSHLAATLERGSGSGGGGFSVRYRALTKALCGLVEDFGLVGFAPLAVEDPRAVAAVIALADKATGACYADLDGKTGPVPSRVLPAAQASAHRAADDDLWAELAERHAEGLDVDEAAWLGDAAPSARLRRGMGIKTAREQEQEQEDEEEDLMGLDLELLAAAGPDGWGSKARAAAAAAGPSSSVPGSWRPAATARRVVVERPQTKNEGEASGGAAAAAAANPAAGAAGGGAGAGAGAGGGGREKSATRSSAAASETSKG